MNQENKIDTIIDIIGEDNDDGFEFNPELHLSEDIFYNFYTESGDLMLLTNSYGQSWKYFSNEDQETIYQAILNTEYE